MKVSNWLSASAAAHPDRPALVCGERQLTYAELNRQAAESARRLTGLGLARGDRVATTLTAGIDLAVLTHGAMRVGAALAPIDPALPDGERDDLLDALGPALTIEHADQLADAALGAEPSEQAT